ncbi:MAG: MBL fold metallo-hydrolase, partial [SAR324 cluster bacterium]|nr:MBL fold metallo-hydrolase [SAR324 cluster bacterium]
MKQLHRKDLFSWSVFNEERNIDFHGILWVRENGNVLIDPMPMSVHD